METEPLQVLTCIFVIHLNLTDNMFSKCLRYCNNIKNSIKNANYVGYERGMLKRITHQACLMRYSFNYRK